LNAPKATPYLLSLGLLAVTSCAGPHHDEREEVHQHGDHQHHHTSAESWAAALDDPERAGRQKPGEVVAAMTLREGMVVADVGAGTGYFEPHLSRAVGASGRVLALDIEPDLVRHMQRRFDEAGLGNVEARLVAPDDPGLTAGSVDRVLIVDTWHHMEGRVDYARKLREALTSAGQLMIVDYLVEAERGPPPEMRVSAEAVMAELKAAGFTARVVPETLPDQFIVVGEP
jgi:cyclopropane fatty-acyl-phospholipid synthase-like methyltransferase